MCRRTTNINKYTHVHARRRVDRARRRSETCIGSLCRRTTSASRPDFICQAVLVRCKSAQGTSTPPQCQTKRRTAQGPQGLLGHQLSYSYSDQPLLQQDIEAKTEKNSFPKPQQSRAMIYYAHSRLDLLNEELTQSREGTSATVADLCR